MAYPTFREFLHERIGKNWVIARRTRQIVERYGDDVVTLSPKQYDALKDEWINNHPALQLVLRLLPPGDELVLVNKAVRRELASH